MSPDTQDQFIKTISSDIAEAQLSGSDRTMLNYAIKLTRNPGQITEMDINQLRLEGFDDRAVHDICAIVSYYAFVNRIADGLGVELEGRS